MSACRAALRAPRTRRAGVSSSASAPSVRKRHAAAPLPQMQIAAGLSRQSSAVCRSHIVRTEQRRRYTVVMPRVREKARQPEEIRAAYRMWQSAPAAK